MMEVDCTFKPLEEFKMSYETRKNYLKNYCYNIYYYCFRNFYIYLVGSFKKSKFNEVLADLGHKDIKI